MLPAPTGPVPLPGSMPGAMPQLVPWMPQFVPVPGAVPQFMFMPSMLPLLANPAAVLAAAPPPPCPQPDVPAPGVVGTKKRPATDMRSGNAVSEPSPTQRRRLEGVADTPAAAVADSADVHDSTDVHAPPTSSQTGELEQEPKILTPRPWVSMEKDID